MINNTKPSTEINMRVAFSKMLKEEMSMNSNIVILTGDLGYGILDNIKNFNHNQFINVGSSEVLMIGMAIGMTLQNKIVLAYSITPFLLYRPFELIRNYINYEKIPVKLVGTGRGKDYLHDGISHWAEDDSYIMNGFENIHSFHPNNAVELGDMFKEFLYNDKPSYLNLKR